MKFLDGYKTYIGGVGQILTGLGGLCTHALDPIPALILVSTGFVTIGLRSFGTKVLSVLQGLK